VESENPDDPGLSSILRRESRHAPDDGAVDVYASQVSFLAGGAIGQASPSVLGINLTLGPRDLKEGLLE